MNDYPVKRRDNVNVTGPADELRDAGRLETQGMTMEVDGFWDRNHRFSYLVAVEIAHRIQGNPGLLVTALTHLERFASGDPRQAKGYALWRHLLTRTPEEIISRLVERSESGDYVRQTAPSFGALPANVRSRLVAAARRPLEQHDKTGSR